MNPSNEHKTPTPGNNIRQLTPFENGLMAKPWRFWIVIIVSGIIVHLSVNLAMLLAFGKFGYRFDHGLSPFPWVAIGAIISQGIDLFSGTIPDLSWGVNHTLSLVVLLIFSFIAPTLFLTNWRRFQLANAPFKESTSIRKTLAGLMIGAMCLLYFGLAPYLVSGVHPK